LGLRAGFLPKAIALGSAISRPERGGRRSILTDETIEDYLSGDFHHDMDDIREIEDFLERTMRHAKAS